MNTAEIETFTARLLRFTAKGLAVRDSEELADRLVIRDRDQDTRTACRECRHLAGHGVGAWRCGNWQTASIARAPQLPTGFAVQLQRCDGFTPPARAQ
jgi:hypothetical protein